MRVLVLAPVFPPRGGPGAIRYAHLCRHWARAGHTVDVVTSSVGWHEDYGLSALVDVEGLTVCRVPGADVGAWAGAGFFSWLSSGPGVATQPNPSVRKAFGVDGSPSLAGLARRVRGLRERLKNPSVDAGVWGLAARKAKAVRDQVAVPDEQLAYVVGWARALEHRLKGQHYDALLTTSYPYSAHLAGALVKMRHRGLRWVMELRDPWAGTRFRSRSRGLASRIDARLERFCVSRADAVSVISQQMERIYRERYADAELFVTPNGYEPSSPLSPAPEPPPYVFGYTGSFDHQVSPALPVVEMLDRLLGNGVELELLWAGTADLPSADVLRRFDRLHPGVLKRLGQLPFGNVRQVRQASHFLVLTLGAGAPVYTTKVFEYLDSERPVFALVGDGELRSRLQGLAHVQCDAASSKEELAALRAQPITRPAFLESNTYSELAARLAEALR